MDFESHTPAETELQPDALAGSLLAGRFRVERWLGAGSCGTVFAAFDSELRRRVAIKVLEIRQPDALLRFKREFRALSDISHPNLVALHELYAESGRWFFTMDLVDGVDLLTYVRSATTVSADANVSDRASGDALLVLRAVFHQLAQGVSALHARGCLHRDLKPSNVLVSANAHVHILDFGLVADLRGDGVGQSTAQQIVGTAAYMAPEQATHPTPDAPADWYSVGVMLYEALTGELPFSGTSVGILLDKQHREAPSPKSRRPDVPDDLNRLCNALLQRDPSRRARAHEIREALPDIAVPSGQVTAHESSLPAVDSVIGREAELYVLDSARALAEAGRAVLVSMHGTSGVGKSALLREFAARAARDHSAVVLAGRCYERESVPYKAVDGLIDALARYLSRLPPVQAAALLPRDAGTLIQLFPVLERAVPGLLSSPRTVQPTDAQDRRRRAFVAMHELLARIAERSLLVLMLDDVQWGDVDSALLLATALGDAAPPPMLVVLSYRSEDAERSPFLSTLRTALSSADHAGLAVERREMQVLPLDANSARQLASDILAADAPDETRAGVDHTADWVAREAQGNPYFIRELVQYARLTRRNASGGDARARPRLDEALRARVEQLPSDARRLLEIIAVSGLPLSLSVAVQASALADGDQSAIHVLRAHHLVRTSGTHDMTVETYHDRIREAVVSALTPEILQSHHRQLAGALEASGNADAEALAHHFGEAGDSVRAGGYAVVAAAEASTALAVERAVRLYQMAFDLLAPARDVRVGAVRIKLADALATAGRGPEAARLYLDAAAGGSSPAEVEFRRRAAEQLIRSGHLQHGLAVAQDVLAGVNMRLHPRSARSVLALLVNRAYLAVRGNRFVARRAETIPEDVLRRIDICWTLSLALSVAEPLLGALFQSRQLLLALRAGEPHRIARALAADVSFSSFRGSASRHRTARIQRAAERMLPTLTDPEAERVLSLTKGMSAFLEGRFTDAAVLFDAAERFFRERGTGTWWEIANSRMFAVRILYYTGRFARATEQVEAAIVATRERGDLYAAAALHTSMAMALLVVTDAPERSRVALQRSAETWPASAFDVPRFSAMLAHAEVELYAGEAAAGWVRLMQHLPEIRASRLLSVQFLRVLYYDVRCRCALAAAAVAGNSARCDEFQRAARRDFAQLRRTGAAWADALGLLREGAWYSLQGKQREALAATERAVEALDRVGLRMYASAARRRSGELRGGEDGAALVARSVAEMRAESIGSPERVTALYAPGFAGG